MAAMPLASLLLFLFSQASTGAAPLLGAVQPGVHPVGYRILQLRDASRPMGAKLTADGQPRRNRARVLHLHLWYPRPRPVDRR